MHAQTCRHAGGRTGSSQKKNLMAIRTNTRNLLDNPPIPVQAKLATAWTTGSRKVVDSTRTPVATLPGPWGQRPGVLSFFGTAIGMVRIAAPAIAALPTRS